MCGIAGIAGENDRERAAVLVRAMAKRMVRRGPDGYGEHIENGIAMAMRRLSIIDLDHGGQPLTSRNGRVIAFQNGEIYNYRQLKRELSDRDYVFVTDSDTEVLAHGYACWGMTGVLERIDGMFALAILDVDAQTLHLARDRFGEKPLFYTDSGDRFAYASNLLCLATLPWVNPSIDLLSLDRYLALHYTPGERTIFSGMYRVLPGERLELSLRDRTISKHRYYTLPLGEKGSRVSASELEAKLQHAVISRLVADVPVGIFLSGGIDSSLVAAIAAEHSPGIHTFSMGFASNAHDESAYAKLVAESVGSTHHHFVFDEASFNELLPSAIEGLDEPLGDQALLPVYWLSREAAKVVKVVLSGEGADEVFGGYDYYRPSASPTWKQRIRAAWQRGAATPAPVTSTLIANGPPITPSGFPLLLDRHGRRMFLPIEEPEIDPWEHDLMARLDRAENSLQRATGADMLTWLPDDLLVKLDRMAMANSLEGRAPYLQPELVRSAMTGLRPLDRMAGTTSKVALRRLASHRLPPTICTRRKQGFVLPMRQWLHGWLRAHGGAAAYVHETNLLAVPTASIRGWLVEEERVGIGNERLAFALIALIEWLRHAQRSIEAVRFDYSTPMESRF
jgi:asparagine synthase (glutamine-hydrolysing)